MAMVMSMAVVTVFFVLAVLSFTPAFGLDVSVWVDNNELKSVVDSSSAIEEWVVKSGQAFSLVCHGGGEHVTWSSDYYQPTSEELVTVRESDQFVANLTIARPGYLNTGTYTCHPSTAGYNSSQAKDIYVYVTDPDNTLALSKEEKSFKYWQDDDNKIMEIPCRPTDVDLNVTLLINGMTSHDLDTEFENHKGFKVHLNDDWIVPRHGSCQVRKNGSEIVIAEYKFHLNKCKSSTFVSAPSIERINTGKNVILQCNVEHKFGDSVTQTWIIQHRDKFPSGHYEESHHFTSHVSVKGDSLIQRSHLNLTIHDVNDDDSQLYRCYVEDCNGNRNSSTYYLTINKASKITDREIKTSDFDKLKIQNILKEENEKRMEIITRLKQIVEAEHILKCKEYEKRMTLLTDLHNRVKSQNNFEEILNLYNQIG